MRQLGTAFLATLILIGCRDNNNETENDHRQWQSERDVNLRAENGFVNLIGLYWLSEGENTIGSGRWNTIEFPVGVPADIGSLTLINGKVTFSSSPLLNVTVDSILADTALVFDQSTGTNRTMQAGRYKWNIIERACNYGIRLRDLEHPATKTPLGIEYFPHNKKYIVEASIEKLEDSETITIQNIIGHEFDEVFEYVLRFDLDGKELELIPSVDTEGMFIMFADETSGTETYGAGRYLVAGLPVDGKVMLDFNKAYNPPCAFTDYATCPLPPEENILPIEIRAGEMLWRGEGHNK